MSRAPAERPVSFRYRPARPTPFVDLRGEVTHWLEPHALRRTPDGWLEVTLPLGPGVYSYKFQHADGSWHLDPENPRTQQRDGVVNSVVCVGGTPEPILHAPEAPWLAATEGGLFQVRAALRRGAGHGLRVRWNEGSGWSDARMRPVAQDDSHLTFEVALPLSARELSYVFVLDDGRFVGAPGGAGQAFTFRPEDLTAHAPEWWRDAVLYTVFVDRFRRGDGEGTWPPLADERARAGGDLDGVRHALPHLVDLGITALHLTPIHHAPSSHRYDAIDPRAVDPALGGEPALRRLLDAAHAVGMHVLLDVTVTHVHRDFYAFADVRARGPESRYWHWFDIQTYPFMEGYEPGYRHYAKGEWEQPLLRTSHPGVAEHLVGTFEHWARLGVDGFRIDAAAGISLELTRRITSAVRAIRPDAAIFGEVLPTNTHRWTRDALDAATDFPSQNALLDWLTRDDGQAQSVAEMAERRRLERGGPGWHHIGFTATHDQPRLSSVTGNTDAARLGHLAVLLGPSIPAIYYGDEVGLTSDEPDRGFEDAWPDRLPMRWDPEKWDDDTHELFRAAIALRHQEFALRRGESRPLALENHDGSAADPQVVGFRRGAQNDVVDVLLNASERRQHLRLPAGAPSGTETLLSLQDAEAEGDEVHLGPWSAIVVRRRMNDETKLAWSAIVEANDALAGHAYAEGWDELATLPTRLYLTSTERCNIRCAHCITDAPARTADGSARSMMPWVLDALEPAFAAASYFGFSHGGESMVAPLFWQTLKRIERARSGRPYDLHLLSNGMRLDETRLQRLLSLGLNSLAISVDGASAATNDTLRVGASLDRVLAHVRGAVALRAKLGVDLRIGLSSVVSRRSLAELAQLADLAVQLGVDWLKIEEMYPCTPVAAEQLVRPSEPALVVAMAQVRERLEAGGVVLVDHLRDVPGCGECADDSARRFREADDFANRATFRPCRMLFEQACIDPDGTVRAVDYLSAPLGNLREHSMLELWNGPDLRHERRAALRREPVERRRRCVAATQTANS